MDAIRKAVEEYEKEELEAKRPSPEEDDGADFFGDAALELDPPDEGDLGVIHEVVLASFSRPRADGAPNRRRKPR